MGFSDVYHSKIKASLDEDCAAIVDGFQDIINSGARPAFRLMNYYKGLPISYPATIVEISRGILELDVHQQQAVAIEKSRRVFIKCSYFSSAILADVHNANVRKMTASLKNFCFVEIMAERRDALRLELDAPTEAEISSGSIKLCGRLYDISLGGFSIRTDERCTFGKGAEVDLHLMIPNLLHNSVTGIDTKARHVETVKGVDGDICRFCFEADQQSEAAISRFIFQRQVEIIREIKEAS